ncbi:MAG: glycogen-binding domain-containing protein [Candidatus Eisenbacteria bacterium]
MRSRWIRGAAIAWAVIGLSGCGGLSFVKRRLPPPYAVEEGVLFQFEAPSAQRVQLAGNWPDNNWLRGRAETGSYLIGLMEDPDKDGIWTLVVELPPGRYQYKFVVDEHTWKEDPNNPQRVNDGYGGNNSLLVVDR